MVIEVLIHTVAIESQLVQKQIWVDYDLNLAMELLDMETLETFVVVGDNWIAGDDIAGTAMKSFLLVDFSYFQIHYHVSDASYVGYSMTYDNQLNHAID